MNDARGHKKNFMQDCILFFCLFISMRAFSMSGDKSSLLLQEEKQPSSNIYQYLLRREKCKDEWDKWRRASPNTLSQAAKEYIDTFMQYDAQIRNEIEVNKTNVEQDLQRTYEWFARSAQGNLYAFLGAGIAGVFGVNSGLMSAFFFSDDIQENGDKNTNIVWGTAFAGLSVGLSSAAIALGANAINRQKHVNNVLKFLKERAQEYNLKINLYV